MHGGEFARRWKEIALSFLKLGITAYGGLAITAAAALAFSPLGIGPILALAAGAGIWLFYSPKVGAVVLMVLTVLLALLHVPLWFPSVALSPLAQATASTPPVGPTALGLFFFKVGALTMIA